MLTKTIIIGLSTIAFSAMGQTSRSAVQSGTGAKAGAAAKSIGSTARSQAGANAASANSVSSAVPSTTRGAANQAAPSSVSSSSAVQAIGSSGSPASTSASVQQNSSVMSLKSLPTTATANAFDVAVGDAIEAAAFDADANSRMEAFANKAAGSFSNTTLLTATQVMKTAAQINEQVGNTLKVNSAAIQAGDQVGIDGKAMGKQCNL